MKIAVLAALVATGVMAGGCAGTAPSGSTSSTGIRSEVFRVADGGSVPAGYADVVVTCSLKTHKPGIHASNDTHGTSSYKLLLNIDGQATELRSKLRGELSELQGLRDAEAGDGMRYEFGARLRLKAGRHELRLAVPDDGIAVERNITVPEGSSNLVIEPLYGMASGKRRPAFYGSTEFHAGVRGFQFTLNGQNL